MPTIATIPTPPVNLVLSLCFFNDNFNFLFNSCDNSNWLLLLNNIELKLVIWELRLLIVLSFKTILFSNKKTLVDTRDSSFLSPSPNIRSLITSFTIGLFN